MTVHINTLELENVKRVQALTLVPAETGLTVIGGKNNQGKTSVLDAIAWALGGERYRPSNPAREGGNVSPRLKVTLSNGIQVERSGKNATLKVTDPSGQKAGQQLLNSFVEELALNLPKFMEASEKEKANTLLRIIGIGDQLAALDREEQTLYNQRLWVGQQYRQKEKYAAELPEIPDAPEEEVSVSQLIQRQQDILLKNAENQRKRRKLTQLEEEQQRLEENISLLTEQLQRVQQDLVLARSAASDLVDESTQALEEDIRRADQINHNVRINVEKRRATQEAQQLEANYQQLSAEIDRVRRQRTNLLERSNLPLPGLSVDHGRLLYHGQPWDNMSGSDQLRVSTAIVRQLNPDCGFVLLDKLEQMDLDTLRDFGQWLEAEGLQAIATRVSTGGECSVILEDGLAVAAEPAKPQTDLPLWMQKGGF